jgi:hypothetical protein
MNIGDYQTALGSQAGLSNTGYGQTALGHYAGTQNVADHQTALGIAAGNINSGDYQTALGDSAGNENSGIYQTVVGYRAGLSNTGTYQTAIGSRAGVSNTGSRQTALGDSAGNENSGIYQTALGSLAGYQNKGDRVIGIGVEATSGNTATADDVVAIGYQAGKDNTVANQFIVKQANINTVPLIQGDFLSGNVDVGGSVTASAFYYSSDEKLKMEVKKINSALEDVKKLEGIEFRWKENREKSYGLIAQDVEKVYPELVGTREIFDETTNETKTYKTVQYGNLVAPLIESVKDLDDHDLELKNKINDLETELEILKLQVNSLKNN